MEQQSIQTSFFDGDDQIIFSKTFNLYENKLVVDNLLGFKFVFIFEKNEPTEGQKDMELSGSGSEATIKISKKIRNTLGSGNTNKFPIAEFADNRKLLFSLYSSQIGNETDALNVTITFYLRKIV